MRVLLAASGGEGHLGPLLPFAAAATTAGDEVLLVVPPEQERTVRDTGSAYELTEGVDPRTMTAIRRAMASGTAADRARIAEVELFGRACTAAALPTVERVLDAFRPDLVLREPCDYGSAVAAHRRGVPTAQVAISPGHADRNGLHLAAAVIEPMAPGVTAAVEQAPYLSRFPRVESGFADSRAYGFAVELEERPREEPPLIWITFGTVNTAFAALEPTWEAVLDAVGGLPIRAIASTGRGRVALRTPPNVEPVPWIGLPEVLARASAVVCHGGSGTTLATLAAGLPLVVVPLLADQPANAAMVEDLGAGIAVRSTATAGHGLQGLDATDVPRVRDAIEAVLADTSYARSAQRIGHALAERPHVSDVLHALRVGRR